MQKKQADEGVGRGPGGPPHNQCRLVGYVKTKWHWAEGPPQAKAYPTIKSRACGSARDVLTLDMGDPMRKPIALIIASGTLAFAASQTFTGIITDDLCGNADHKAMNMGVDEKCVTECVKGMNASYVLFDGNETYMLSDQKRPAVFAAKKVTVTGTLDAKTKIIKVQKIVAAK